MIKQRFFLKQQHTVDLALLEKWYEQLMPISEFSWGVFEFTREMLRNKVREEEKTKSLKKPSYVVEHGRKKCSTSLI